MLFVIEGIDGAGKGTLARNLVSRAEADRVRVATLSFPRYDDTRFAKLIGQYLNGRFGKLDEVSVHFAALLYAGDRFESRDDLLALIANHDLVILDRYVASNVAYNAAKLPPAERQPLIDWIFETEFDLFALPKPDLTGLLGTSPDTADDLVARKDTRSYTDSKKDLHEADRAYMTEVARVYDQLCVDNAKGPWLRFDPTGPDDQLLPPGHIADGVWREIKARL